ncbi:hypothetical protein C3B44_04090 [Corynebacterium yudongzhengii]|uniref:Uncharacterized protein n=1 Tax=Corynebacterium yudongzhengii TaxID=2080740 RepID=A0A2U1T6D5_9CORY|nr:hypothetical protein [Corynebacterium yudongzhengii]AWB81645.1 hypothetical protein C3B44_04090 [Corynebacterium yudongzhengii]PWC01552.1 hypothetical protein DF222_07085 [Corynebacterium yudongzhengii]
MTVPTRESRSPLIAFLLALLTLVIAIVLYIRNGFGIDSAVFGVATLILLFAGFSRFHKNRDA